MKYIEFPRECVKFNRSKKALEDTFGTDDYNTCARLLAYIQHVLMNGRELDWNKLHNYEAELVHQWIDNHVIYYNDGKIYMKKSEYDKMCDILFDAYIYFEMKEGGEDE